MVRLDQTTAGAPGRADTRAGERVETGGRAGTEVLAAALFLLADSPQGNAKNRRPQGSPLAAGSWWFPHLR